MNTPPLLLGLTLLFWGWQTGFLAVGGILGALVELPRVTSARWTFSRSDFDRLWNLCAVLFIGAAVFLFFSEGKFTFDEFLAEAARRPDALREKGQAALSWFQWFPMLFFPFAVAVAWSEDPGVEMSTFSWFLRRYRRANGPSLFPEKVNVAFPYFAVILFASAASNRRSPVFYWCLCFLVGWALWARRSRRYSPALWAGLFAAAVFGGFYSHRGLVRIGRALEEMNVAWFSRFGGYPLDMKRSRTAIGSIGSLALSDTIVLRVQTDGQAPPALLREASYSQFRSPVWQNPPNPPGAPVDLTRVLPEATNNATWLLLPKKEAHKSATIGRYMKGGGGIIAVPNGVAALEDLPAEDMDYTPRGVIRAKGSPGVVEYQTRYDDGAAIDAAPTPDDERPAESNEAAIDQVASDLSLRPGMNPVAAMSRVQAYFSTKFKYSARLTMGHRATSNETALTRFLLRERTGHCEYYATAATLLLRKAGLPTRYAIGYSVQEGSGKRYVVRERHGHAWTLVWHHNAWHDFDATPDGDRGLPGQGVSWLRPVRDFFSNIWFQVSKWRWNSTNFRKYFVWLPAPLVIAAVAAFFLKKQWRQMKRSDKSATRESRRQGEDSEFYDIEALLARRGMERYEAEPIGAWLQRINGRAAAPEALRQVAALHARYRFDPNGLSPADRAGLRESATAYLRELKKRRR